MSTGPLPPPRDGWKGWAALAAVVCMWDAAAMIGGRHETMSVAYGRALRAHRVATLAVTATVVVHLHTNLLRDRS